MVVGFKAFADGRAIVNDVMHKRVVVFDSSLRSMTIIADSTGKPALYPVGPVRSPMFDYLGDSALLLDWTSQAFLLIEPSGRIGRAIAHPRPRDLGSIVNGVQAAAFDTRGRLVYRIAGTPPFPPRPGQPPPPPRSRDTVAIVRADFDSRAVDTVARITLPFFARPVITRDDNGKQSARQIINPLPFPADQWVVTTDGSLAIVRPQDYHIDWVSVDGTEQSTPKMPFDWRRVSDDDKQARIDSVKKLIDSLTATGGRPPNMIISTPLGGSAGTRRADTTYAVVEFVPLAEMPDYVPPFRTNTVKADRDNNVWIPPTTTFAQTNGGVLYDVINRKGEIFERVIIPANRMIAGFGPGGVVYLLAGDYVKGFILERRRIIRSGT